VTSAKQDERFMRMALRQARRGLGLTSPNPAVGAVLTAGEKILARAFHERAGGPHAELKCLGQASGPLPKGATLYVTLEPCSTAGQTGPCTDAIIQAGVRTVVIGAIDVNPRHNGRGIALLRKAGIEVRSGVLSAECSALNESFNKWILTGQPFVIAKCGMSLDGRLTRPPPESRWITNTRARRDAQILRSEVDAILVGAETVRTDNPSLTVRGIAHAKQPWRVILTRSGSMSADAQLLRDRFKEKTLVYRKKSLPSVLRDLGKKRVTSVMIEGGGNILGQALDAGLIDKVQIYLGSMFTGGPVIAFGGRGASSTQTAVRLTRLSYAKLGDNVRVTGYPADRSANTAE
jgi:diaminohydroxyphosphoribosylaminopyrimidine deaminase/5-amino-6-(5-phosphoribosylamino)uracil reductase